MKNWILIENIRKTVLKLNHTKFIVTIFIEALDLKQVLRSVVDSQRYRIKKKKCNITKYCSISYFVKIFKCNNLIKAFIVFIQQCHRKNDDINKDNREIYCLKKDFFWISELTIYVYDVLLYWKTNDKIDNNFEKLIKEYIRCAFNWQNANKWKQNYILMQNQTISIKKYKKYCKTNFCILLDLSFYTSSCEIYTWLRTTSELSVKELI